MKKFLALLLALILGLIGTNVTMKTNMTDDTLNTVRVDIDRPTETSRTEWAKGYYARCARATIRTSRTNYKRCAKRMGRIVAMPMLLMLGVMPTHQTPTQVHNLYEINRKRATVRNAVAQRQIIERRAQIEEAERISKERIDKLIRKIGNVKSSLITKTEERDKIIRSIRARKGVLTKANNIHKNGLGAARAAVKLNNTQIQLGVAERRIKEDADRLAILETKLTNEKNRRNRWLKGLLANEEKLAATIAEYEEELRIIDEAEKAIAKVTVVSTSGAYTKVFCDTAHAENFAKAIVATVKDKIEDTEKADVNHIRVLIHTSEGTKTITTRTKKGEQYSNGLAGDILAKHLTMTDNEPKTDQDLRTNMPEIPAWVVSVVDETTMEPVWAVPFDKDGETDARTIFEKSKEDGLSVVLLHLGIPVDSTLDDKVTLKSGLVKRKSFELGFAHMLRREDKQIGVSPLMRKIAEWTNSEPGEKVASLECAVEGFDSKKESVREDAETKAAFLTKVAHDGFDVEKELWAVYGHGTNDAKKGVLRATIANIVDKIHEFASNGALKTWLVSPAKYYAYNGLMDVKIAPYTKREIHISIKDIEFLNTTIREVTDADGFIEIDEKGSIAYVGSTEQKGSDGTEVLSISKKKMDEYKESHTPEEYKRFVRAYKRLMAHSNRAPLMKGACVILNVDGAQTFLRSIGVEKLNGKDIDDIAIFADMSVFKGKFDEKDGSHRDKAHYDTNFERLHTEDDFGILLEGHNPAHMEAGLLNNQSWRGLAGAPEEMINQLCKDEEERIENMPVSKIIGGKLGLYIEAHPELQELPCINKMINVYKRRMIEEARQGRFHGLTYNFIGNGDIFSWLHWNATGETVDYIPAGKVIIRGATNIITKEGMKVTIGRSPTYGLVVREAYTSFEAAGCRNGALLDAITKADGTIFFSNADACITKMQGDYDGDHFFVITNENFTKAVMAADHRPITVSKMNKADKPIITAEVLAEYASNICHTPGCGRWDDAFTKVIADIPVGEHLDEEHIVALAQAEYLFQNDVDSGKHGSSMVDNFEMSTLLDTLIGSKMPLGVYQNKVERWPERKYNEDKIADTYGNSIMDTIRVWGNRLAENFKPRLIDTDVMVDTTELMLPDGEMNPAIFGLAAKPTYRFFRELEDGLATEPSELNYYDSLNDAIDSIQNGAFTKQFRDEVKYTEFACVKDDDDKNHIYDIFGNEIAGKMILDETTGGFFNALQSRYNEVIMALMTDQSLRVKGTAYKANIAKYARIALATYGFLYGYDIKDVFNKLVSIMFKIGKDRAWRPNSFALRFFEMVFGPEIVEQIDAEERCLNVAEYIDCDDESANE